MMEEHDHKLREEATNHEDDIELIQHELSQQVEENKQCMQHFESEIGLRNQQIEALEKYLFEPKESLDR